VSPELSQAAISDSCGDYHYHSVQREKTDAHAEKFHQVIFSRLVAAQELKYHHFCLTALYNKERAYLLTIENQDDIKLSREREVYALVFSELFTYILGIKTSSDNPVAFRLLKEI
jgi:hypothetical protein